MSRSVPEVSKSFNVLKINKGSDSPASASATSNSPAIKRVTSEHSDVSKISTVVSVNNGHSGDDNKMDTSEQIVEVRGSYKMCVHQSINCN